MQLEALSVPGNRGKAACQRVATVSTPLATALRRAVPFLSRQRLGVSTDPATCHTFASLAADPTLVHATPFAIKSGRSSVVRGLILLDHVALARILDGVLGGDGEAPEELAPAAPTSAQTALASRVTVNMLRAFAGVIEPELGVAIEASANKDVEAGTAVVIPLGIENGGRVLVAIPLSAISEDEPAETEHFDSGIAAAITDVELDVVAELGKVRLSLAAIARFQVGDVIRLQLPLDERARICAGGATLFQGRPTASGDSVAVAIEQ